MEDKVEFWSALLEICSCLLKNCTFLFDLLFNPWCLCTLMYLDLSLSPFFIPGRGGGWSPQFVPESPRDIVDQLQTHEQTPVMNSQELDYGGMGVVIYWAGEVVVERQVTVASGRRSLGWRRGPNASTTRRWPHRKFLCLLLKKLCSIQYFKCLHCRCTQWARSASRTSSMSTNNCSALSANTQKGSSCTATWPHCSR